VIFERLIASPIALANDFRDLLELTTLCHYSGFPQPVAELFRLLVCKSGTKFA
jgi:hypothetical protein